MLARSSLPRPVRRNFKNSTSAERSKARASPPLDPAEPGPIGARTSNASMAPAWDLIVFVLAAASLEGSAQRPSNAQADCGPVLAARSAKASGVCHPDQSRRLLSASMGRPREGDVFARVERSPCSSGAIATGARACCPSVAQARNASPASACTSLRRLRRTMVPVQVPATTVASAGRCAAACANARRHRFQSRFRNGPIAA